ncbi:hypothetical protein SK128_021942 [Halocaridina rubra]|uniref:MD-2-related lipid-recognition domain-containing protein n=1 Tax=Halocaridina rubra TaxID=373956 RepID=A0AAN8XRL2_HALRR
MKSDIYAWVRIGLPSLGRREPTRIAMPGETNKPICQFTSPGCPVYPGVRTTISKTITIPPQARLAESPMLVELHISDPKGRIITCFRAPVIVG